MMAGAMATSNLPTKPRYAKPVRILQFHLKLVVAAIVGFVVYFILSVDLRVTTRLLVAWNMGVTLYLILAFFVVARSGLNHLRRRAAEEDEGAAAILMLTIAAAAVSVVAIFAELGATRADKGSGPALLALITVVLSWVFIQVIFAFRYAHEFYGEAKGGHKGGLTFPDDDQPEYWDFVYFSFVIGMTFQVSDVQVTSKSLRRVVVGHGIVSFFYNVAVLALMVNLGSEFIKG